MTVSREIHLTAIGGVGMTALAGLLCSLGHRVRGSDLEVYPPASDELARLGVPVAGGYRAENLEPRPDLVVMGNAISRDNPEAVAARSAGIETLSMPQALARFCLPGRVPLVLAGTPSESLNNFFEKNIPGIQLFGPGRSPAGKFLTGGRPGPNN